MRNIALTVVGLSLLACGGSMSVPSGPADLSTLSGEWCSRDPDVGCYTFNGSEVVEQRPGGKHVGQWYQSGDHVFMEFDDGDWELRIEAYEPGNKLVLYDIEQIDTYRFFKQ